MLNFSTLFDSFYLSRGVAMSQSLEQHCKDYHLYIFAFDDIAFDILKKLNLNNVTVISLNEFETRELLEVKKNRTKAEYCWTCTPSTISYVLNHYNVDSCTYLDADLFFFSDPAVLVQEMLDHNKSVLITEHGFSPLARLYEEKRAGRFCVQFVTFLNQKDSLEVLEKWRLQCIDWCYARYEDGKFGDQKYLNEWPITYDNVHILEHQGGGVAPWNIQKFSFHKDGDAILGKQKDSLKQFQVVFYHYQYVKLMKNDVVDIGWYPISRNVKSIFYQPYLDIIFKQEKKLINLDQKYQTGITSFNMDGIKNYCKANFKRVTKYNLLRRKSDGLFS